MTEYDELNRLLLMATRKPKAQMTRWEKLKARLKVLFKR